MGAGFENPKLIQLQDDKLKSWKQWALLITYINYLKLAFKCRGGSINTDTFIALYQDKGTKFPSDYEITFPADISHPRYKEI